LSLDGIYWVFGKSDVFPRLLLLSKTGIYCILIWRITPIPKSYNEAFNWGYLFNNIVLITLGCICSGIYIKLSMTGVINESNLFLIQLKDRLLWYLLNCGLYVILIGTYIYIGFKGSSALRIGSLYVAWWNPLN
jgi:hypothetical protein